MNMCSRNSRCWAVQWLLLTLLFMLLCLGSTCVNAAIIKTHAWLNQPAAIWATITENEQTAAAAQLALKSDLSAAVHSIDNAATTEVTALAPYSTPGAGLAYGANVEFTVTSDALTEADILAAVRKASLPSTSLIFFPKSDFPGSVSVLAADEPSSMTSVGPAVLPVTGSTFFWSLILTQLEQVGGALGTNALAASLEADMQSTVGSTLTQFLLLVDMSTYIVNASSVYFPYSMWAFPGTVVTPTTSSAIQALVMGSTLGEFNRLIHAVPTLIPTMSDYKDIFPTPAVPWTPLPGNPFDPTSPVEVPVNPVLLNLTGDYFLLFSGEVERWGSLWEARRDAVSASIEKAIQAMPSGMESTITAKVLSAKTVPSDSTKVGGLEVVCQVTQGVLTSSAHLRTPEESAAMLLHADYSATQSLYDSTAGGVITPPAQPDVSILQSSVLEATPGSIASTRVDYDFSFTFTGEVIGVVAMSSAIVGVSLIIGIVACSFSCCCPQHVPTGSRKKRYASSRKSSDESYAVEENAMKVRNVLSYPDSQVHSADDQGRGRSTMPDDVA
ncbi:hypothetical protein JKF63_04859 [Porcisia hertigi]|uniref:Membrane-associated protein n=1 Tax=Porcisia hertigi TaxID=2761500 RepID=A0A836IMW3_9TRYP|nr:hypothetical protein JKF63_04859 [Porcisia hertigi]